MRTALIIFLTMVWSATAQTVYLRVETISQGKKTTSSSNNGYGSYNRSHAQSSNLKVTVRNMYTAPYDYAVEWKFYAKILQTGNTRVYDSGTNSVSLKIGETKTIELESAEVSSRTTGYADEYSASRQTVGDKQAGYVVLVKADNRIIAVEASDTDLKHSYQDALNAAKLQPKGKQTSVRAAEANDSAKGLVLWYSFDNEMTGKIVDDSRHGNQGMVVGAKRNLEGKCGAAYNFDGKEAYIETPNTDSLCLKKGLTLAAWVYISQHSFDPCIVSKGNIGNYRESYAMLLTRDGRLGFIVNSDGKPGGRTMVSGDVVPLKKWTHVAATYDGSAMRLYVNGKEDASTPRRGSVYSDQHPLLIGKSDRKKSSYQSSYFHGMIDEVRIYQQPLSEAEVQDLLTQCK